MFKKISIFFLIFIMSFSLSFGLDNSQISVTLDDELLSFNVQPQIINGKTLVPLRTIFESLGLTVGWDGATQTVTGTGNGKEIKLTINNSTAYVNGQPITLDVPATIIEGSTLVPARFVAESTGATVGWDSTYRQVKINNAGYTPNQEIYVHFIDVGQGDAILIQCGKFDALIDSGDNSAENTVVNYLKAQNVDDLELFVATHSDSDHIGGADAVLNEFDAEFIADCTWLSESQTFEDYKVAMIKNSSDSKTIYRSTDEDIILAINSDGSQPTYKTEDGMYIKIIGNPEDKDANNSSKIVLLDTGEVEFLLTGDLEAEGEKELLNKFPDVEVLKAGHHGSKTANSTDFLNKVKPETIVISCGLNNKYGHPHFEALNRMFSSGADVYGTEKSGNIVIKTNGNNYWIDTIDKLSINDAGDTGNSPSTTTTQNNTTNTTVQTPTNTNTIPVEYMFVGSSKSNKYHLPSCRYAQSINDENLVYFKSEQEALNAGYEPCGVCKP